MSTSATSDSADAPAAPRSAVLLAGIWAGVLLAIGALVAPVAFATAPADVAGRLAGRLFAIEARAGLGIALVLVLLLRRHARVVAQRSGASLFSVDLRLVLAALFCTVAGHFALQPMMGPARAGQGPLSFGTLHALAAGFYALKSLLVLALAWRLTAAGAGAALSPRPSS